MKTKAASLRQLTPSASLCDALEKVVGDKEKLSIAALHAGMLLCDIGELPAEFMEEELAKLNRDKFREQPVTASLSPAMIIAMMCAIVTDTEKELSEQHTPATAAGKIEAALRMISARYKVNL